MSNVDVGVLNPRAGTADAGGTEAFLRNTLPVVARSCDVTLYTGDGDTNHAFEGVLVRRLPWLRKEHRAVKAVTARTPILPAEIESASMLLGSLGVKRELEQHDVVSTHYYADALLLSRVLRTPVLFRFPGVKHPSVRWKALLRHGDVATFVANSHATANRLQDWFGLTVDDVIKPGVDTDRFSPSRWPKNGRYEHPVVLFVGRLDDGKGVPELIRAHEQMEVDTDLVLVGDGTNREEYERLGRGSSRSDSIYFEGELTHRILPRYYVTADVFCLPSKHEGYPVTVLEALATGTPVVATDIDAIREQVVEGVTGSLVPFGDVDALADAVARTVTATSLRNDATSIARDTARTHSWEQQGSALAAAYERTARTHA